MSILDPVGSLGDPNGTIKFLVLNYMTIQHEFAVGCGAGK
jgi:hypothetical protein